MKGPRRMIIVIPGMTKDGERVPIRPRSVSKSQMYTYIHTHTTIFFFKVQLNILLPNRTIMASS